LPAPLRELLDERIIDDVICPLQSGKEADVFVIERDDETFIAKVYREKSLRSFKNDAAYREGRAVRGSRDARALKNKSSFGRQLSEDTWHQAEAEALETLHAAGVRVPELFARYGRVLIMELVSDSSGELAPQLGKLQLEPERARALGLRDRRSGRWHARRWHHSRGPLALQRPHRRPRSRRH
jgi:RIO kinase 1